MIKSIIKAVNSFLKESYRNEIGSFMAVGFSAAAGAGIAKAATAKEPEIENEFLQNPEYEEAEGARGKWWETLQKWGDDPSYGAISPDWSNIWETVQRQVKQYYDGGPLSTGMRDKLKASLARRNMSDSPASDYLMMASRVEEANDMKDIATEQGKQKSELTEKGRMNWLSSLQNLSQQKPAGQWQTTVTDPNFKNNQWFDLVGDMGSAAAQYGMESEYLDKILAAKDKDDDKKLPTTTPTRGSIWGGGVENWANYKPTTPLPWNPNKPL